MFRRPKPGFPRAAETNLNKVYNDTRCDDCGYETNHNKRKDHGRAEWYMVSEVLWLKALTVRHACFLCIACLEHRLGRALTPQDFPAHIPLNTPEWSRAYDRSRLLRLRMGLLKPILA